MKKFFETLSNIWKIEELRNRIMITLGLLLVYRFGCQIVLPGIDTSQLAALTEGTDQGILMPRYLHWVLCPIFLHR